MRNPSGFTVMAAMTFHMKALKGAGKSRYSQARKIGVGVIGGIVLLVGILLLVLPGPAFLVIPAGLAILATEFIWAQNLLSKAKNYIRHKTKKADGEGSPSPSEPSCGNATESGR